MTGGKAPRPFQRRLVQRHPEDIDAARRWSLFFGLLIAVVILIGTYILVARQDAQPGCLYPTALGQPCGVTPTPFILSVVSPSPSPKPAAR